MPDFQGIVFIQTRTYREIFKSVYPLIKKFINILTCLWKNTISDNDMRPAKDMINKTIKNSTYSLNLKILKANSCDPIDFLQNYFV